MSAIPVESFESFAFTVAQVEWPVLKNVLSSYAATLLYSVEGRAYRLVTTPVSGVHYQSWVTIGTADATEFEESYR